MTFASHSSASCVNRQRVHDATLQINRYLLQLSSPVLCRSLIPLWSVVVLESPHSKNCWIISFKLLRYLLLRVQPSALVVALPLVDGQEEENGRRRVGVRLRELALILQHLDGLLCCRCPLNGHPPSTKVQRSARSGAAVYATWETAIVNFNRLSQDRSSSDGPLLQKKLVFRLSRGGCAKSCELFAGGDSTIGW